MLPHDERLRYVLGTPDGFCSRPLPPFASDVRAFVAALSERLVAEPSTRAMPDLMSFAWWCRKANIERQAARYQDGALRLGRGLAFHVTPTNMPVNFAFSWVFSFLAGNANVVRLPGRDFPQIPAILRTVATLFADARFRGLADMNCFVTYGREEEITRAFSAVADIRIIWGGDATISAIRQFPLPVRGIDVGFADRYSLCVLGAEAVVGMSQVDLERLATGFFNDAYLMDQNACSSPHLVVWLGGEEQAGAAARRFWPALQAEVERRYELAPVTAVDKFTQACRDAIELDDVAGLHHDDMRLYRLRLESLPARIESRRCGGGYFYEYVTNSLDDVAPIVTAKYQTLTYHGIPRDELAAFVLAQRLTGVDRIVPVGAALDIGLLWDGYDLIRTLSRVCDVR